MVVLTRGFHEAHSGIDDRVELLAETARRLPHAGAVERRALLGDVMRFLRDEIVPHTRLDERVLYPEVNARLGNPLATATMNYDHVAIRGLIDDLEAAGIDDTDELQALLYGLCSLIHVHIWKEERLYLAMLDSPGWPAL
jgi:hemerythrin-like domain-containing protein